MTPDASIEPEIDEDRRLNRNDPGKRVQRHGRMCLGDVQVEAKQKRKRPCHDAGNEVMRHCEQRSAVEGQFCHSVALQVFQSRQSPLPSRPGRCRSLGSGAGLVPVLPASAKAGECVCRMSDSIRYAAKRGTREPVLRKALDSRTYQTFTRRQRRSLDIRTKPSAIALGRQRRTALSLRAHSVTSPALTRGISTARSCLRGGHPSQE